MLAHGDYHLNNVIVRDGEIVALVDWEDARIGDSVSDLGCTSFELEVFWKDDGIRNYFLERYQELTHASLRNLKFYEVRAALIFRILSWLVEQHGANELGMQKEADNLFTDIFWLDEIDRFIEERI